MGAWSRSLLLAARGPAEDIGGDVPRDRSPRGDAAGDAYAPRHWSKQYVHYANTYGREKVMFGTDWPVIHPERAIKEVDEFGMDPVAKRMLLRDNALRVFKLPGYRKLKRDAGMAATRRN